MKRPKTDKAREDAIVRVIEKYVALSVAHEMLKREVVLLRELVKH